MTDPKPAKAKRNSVPLSLGKAVDMLVAIESAQAAEEREAVEKVQARFVQRKAVIYGRLPEHLLMAAGSAVAAAISAAASVKRPVIDAEFRDPAVDGDEAPDDEHDEDSDAGVEHGTMPPQIAAEFPETNVVPDRLREPLSAARMAVGRGRK